MDRILVISGPSAAGKTTVMTRILELFDGRFEYIRSATTRGKRGDSHDDEYLYLTRDEFLNLVSSNGILEYMEYGGNLYGTPRSEIERIFASGRIPLLILDLVGVESLKSKLGRDSVFSVYVYEDLSVIDERLLSRYERKESDKRSCEERMAQNRRDYLSLPDKAQNFDLALKNTTVTETAENILSAFFSSHCTAEGSVSEIFEHLRESAL